MEQLLLSRYAHRAGYVLLGRAICDGYFHIFKDGEIGLRCMKCSGFICPDGNERNIRQVDLTTTVLGNVDNNQSFALSSSTPYSGYDLCLDCAKDRHLHTHHHFTLAICHS